MVVIDNRFNDHGYKRSNLPVEIPDGDLLGLEGNFSKYYTVSTSSGSERDAIHMMSPDFMEAIIDQANNKVDIEISDNNLFLIYEDDYYSEQNIKSLFSVADVVLSKLSRLSKTWQASSARWETQEISQKARNTRNKLISKSGLLGLICYLVIITIFMVLLLSRLGE